MQEMVKNEFNYSPKWFLSGLGTNHRWSSYPNEHIVDLLTVDDRSVKEYIWFTSFISQKIHHDSRLPISKHGLMYLKEQYTKNHAFSPDFMGKSRSFDGFRPSIIVVAPLIMNIQRKSNYVIDRRANIGWMGR